MSGASPDPHTWLQLARSHGATRADARLSAILDDASLTIPSNPSNTWESSHRTVFAYALTLWVTAEAMASLARSTSLREALIAVVASANGDPACVAASVCVRWGRVREDAASYRSALARDLRRDDERELHAGLCAFLRGMDSAVALAAIAAITSARARATHDGIALHGVPATTRGAVREALSPLCESLTFD
jgi:hypothetical protein